MALIFSEPNLFVDFLFFFLPQQCGRVDCELQRVVTRQNYVTIQHVQRLVQCAVGREIIRDVVDVLPNQEILKTKVLLTRYFFFFFATPQI